MRKFHFIVVNSLERYKDRPFTSKTTIREEVENLIYLYNKIEEVDYTEKFKKIIEEEYIKAWKLSGNNTELIYNGSTTTNSLVLWNPRRGCNIDTTNIGNLIDQVC